VEDGSQVGYGHRLIPSSQHDFAVERRDWWRSFVNPSTGCRATTARLAAAGGDLARAKVVRSRWGLPSSTETLATATTAMRFGAVFATYAYR
jgi:hypothetical protein